MATDQPNFLLGYGEYLTQKVQYPPKDMDEKQFAYGVEEARARLSPMLHEVTDALETLPREACPRDEAVALLTLHPQCLAKSFYPARLLHEVGLRPVGSRPSKVKPEKWTKKGAPTEEDSTELLVAGTRAAFRAWSASLDTPRQVYSPGAADLPKVESLRAFAPGERLRPLPKDASKLLLDVALHAKPEDADILTAFDKYAKGLAKDTVVDHTRGLFAGGLYFVPVLARKAVVPDLEKFSFLRVARPMPQLRLLEPALRAWKGPKPFACTLPSEDAVSSGLHAAVFDGGALPLPDLSRWVEPLDAPGVGTAVPDYLEHGTQVTSALLFGSLVAGSPAARPYGKIKHFRVLDSETGQNGTAYQLYDVLHRIRTILQANRFQFVNLSIGPELPIEDHDVDPWTSVLDELLSNGETLLTVAVGNGGERHYNRIQVPADSVNALSVGAANSRGPVWVRAPYSSIGPGRSPGFMKPDVVAFGGSLDEPFWTINPSKPSESMHCGGTSFASPEALRLGMGVKALFGDVLGPLAIKALLIHCSQRDVVNHATRDVGWGRIPTELEQLALCPPASARIVYQGELSAGKYLRAQIPIPDGELKGHVTIRATLCYATETDPNHPGNYTKSGLTVAFRPNEDDVEENALYARTDGFFQLKDFATEAELRHDAHKWETVLHKDKQKRWSSLKNPVFDIHYNARDESSPASGAPKIRYAMLITVSSPKTKDLYDRVVTRYRTLIQPLRPVVQIPIRVKR